MKNSKPRTKTCKTLPSTNTKDGSAARSQGDKLICVLGVDKGRHAANMPRQENTPLLASEQDKGLHKQVPGRISSTRYPQKPVGAFLLLSIPGEMAGLTALKCSM